MLVSIAGQFSFGEQELWDLPRSRIVWWYGAVKELNGDGDK